MSNIYKQTWWDTNLPNESMFNTFLGWVGDSEAESKIKFRQFLKNRNFKNILDVGCGPATEYFGFKKDDIVIEYMGVDSSQFLVDYNLRRGIPMLMSEAHDIALTDNSYEVVFSRHLLEHQPSFEPVLDEIIRISSKLAVHIWFHKPADEEKIDFDDGQKLYHNFYRREDIEKHLMQNDKVKNFEWLDVNAEENILLIWIKDSV